MSIKKLFDSTNKNRNYLSDTDEKNAFENVESERNLRAIKTTQDTFIPQVDYEKPAKFAQYGSAYLYYKSAIERIHDYYPYDGSDAEINEFYNACLPIEQYIFDNRYPRTTGYITMSVGGWGTKTNNMVASGGYGVSSTPEYITFYGGPNTISHTKLQQVFPNAYDDKYQYSNIYDTDIYTTAGLPSTYGSGSRESNLKSDFDKGVTVEFWFKTGSADPLATYTNHTQKQVIFDLWNNEVSSSADYGRITVEIDTLTGSSPFLVTVQSGASSDASRYASGCFQQPMATDIGSASWIGSTLDGTYCLSSWKHYAFSMYNTGSDFVIKLHVDGELQDTYISSSMTLGALNSKNMMGRLGALLTAPSGTIGEPLTEAPASVLAGAGKLAGSLDEFRFWKVRRNSDEIARYWKSQVRGGTNTDISNTTLGVYYKFNEGITTDTTLDSTVLDYSGRVSNGAWTGYVTNSRNSGSAMVSASVRTSEYRDPVVYSTHPSVTSLKTELLDRGEKYDLGNNSAFVNMMPSWVLEEDESLTSDLRKMSHIVATYLDKLRLQIEALPSFKGSIYTTASAAPVPFAQHLPQSLGLYTPDVFIEADVMETFLNRDQNTFFEGDLNEAKNLIYLNLYNNLAGIYKAKGTEKAIKNVFRCFNIDDKLVRLKTYSNNQVYDLQDNLKQYFYEDTSINCNLQANVGGVVYQRKEPGNPESLGFISGTYGRTIKGASTTAVREGNYGFTAESSVIFPAFNIQSDYNLISRDFVKSSLFGMYTVNTASNVVKRGINTQWVDFGEDAEDILDYANFQVFAIRDEPNSKNARFMLTSSRNPFAGQFPALTSSNFFNVYDNEEWHLSVRMKPSNYPLSNVVSGATTYTYDLEFRGVNAVLDTIQNSFLLTASIGQSAGENFLQSAKRMYLGAERTNITGALLNRSDVLFGSMKYYAKYIENGILDQHLYNERNVGVSASYQNISALDPSLSTSDALNSNTLALDWTFDTLTASTVAGTFFPVKDASSGSAGRRADHWLGGITGYEHAGYGQHFTASSTDIISKDLYNALKFTDPEEVVASTMVQVLSDDDIVFGTLQAPPTFFHAIEKSMYNAISEEMLIFFAGAIDFHNLIGEPVNRYRERYKSLEKLRETFFRRVTTVSSVEKFIEYYKWFDDALALIVAQLLPASSELVPDVADVIESHVLERNKYKTPFPTLEFEEPGVEVADLLGVSYLVESWPDWYKLAESPRATNAPEDFWKYRALRNASEISASAPGVNIQREYYRETIGIESEASGSKFRNTDGTSYTRTNYWTKYKARPYVFKVDLLGKPPTKKASTRRTTTREIKGGTNFDRPVPHLGFLYNATRPAGPVNKDNGVFVPLNVLLAPMSEIAEWNEIKSNPANRLPNSKEKRYFKVFYGPDYQSGYGPNNVKSTVAFPFNILSSSVSGGYNKQIVESVGASLEVTNLHHDVYGPEMERPMQGPFPEAVVGGHQSRHIALNKGPTLDTYLTRPEAWKILLGTCTTINGTAGAIGIAGADYPWPEANAEGQNPYPMTGAQKAIYYRGFTAKRPVNIRNIHLTGSAIGNYRQNYEVVSTFGAYSNPRQFVENAPTLPTELTQTPSGTQGRTFLDIRRDAEGHFQFTPDYSVAYLRSAGTKATTPTLTVTDYPGGGASGDTFTLKDTNGKSVTFQADGTTTTADGTKNAAGNVIIGTFGGSLTLADVAGRIVTAINGANTTYGYIAITATQDGSTVNFTLAQDVAGKSGNISIDMSDWDGLVSTAFAGGTDRAFTGKSVISTRFANPGGVDTMGIGYKDVRSAEYSVYSACNFRNWSVIRPFQNTELNMVSEVTGAGTPGIRVSDINGLDFGWRDHLKQHSAQFGRSSFVYPPDSQRPAYTLADNFMGYSSTDIYRGAFTLQGWWRLQDNVSVTGSVPDASGKGRGGTFDSGSHTRPGYSTTLYPSRYIQKASETWSTSSAMVNIGTAATWDDIIGPDGTSKMTLSAWVYKTGNGGGNFGRIVDFSAGDVQFYTLSADAIVLGVAAWNGTNGSWQTAGGVFSKNTWHHLVVTYDAGSASNDPVFYVDGQQVAISTSTTPTGTYATFAGTDCYIGNRTNGDRNFEGQLADVVTWNSILTQTDITAIYNESKTPYQAGPGVINNQSPSMYKINRNPLKRLKLIGPQTALSGALVNTSSINFTATDGACLVLSGAYDWQEGYELFHAVTSSGISYTTWFQHPDDAVARQMLQVGVDDDNGHPSFGVTRVTDMKIQVSMATQDAETGGTNDLAEWTMTNSDVYEPHTWTHLAVTWQADNGSVDAGTPIIYINGAVQALTVDDAPSAYYQDDMEPQFDFKDFSGTPYVGFTGEQFVVLGSSEGDTGRPFTGSMDQITLWKRKLTADEVGEIYNEGIPCNVTASSVYTDNPSSLFDWIRCGVDADVIDSANPGVLSATNRINGFVHNGTTAYLPLATEGDTNTLALNTLDPVPTGGCTGSEVLVDVYTTSSQFDNAYVQHQIPRSDRQYAWVTGAIVRPSADLRYWGTAPIAGPLAGYYSSSADGYTAYFNFMSASSVLGAIGTASLYQPAKRLNIYVVDPIDLASNTLGIAATQSVTSSYNDTLLDVYNIKDDLNLRSDYLNLLLTKRRSAFKTRNIPLMSPVKDQILQKHAQQSQITLKSGKGALQTYAFKPASMRGRPVYLNLDANQLNSTYCFTWNNELLYCSDQKLNQLLEIKEDKTTMFDKAISIANTKAAYDINWILYSEMMFPTRIKELTSGSAERPNYDNRFWRTTQAQRITVGDTVGENSFNVLVSQSSWPLDAPLDFITRTDVPSVSIPPTARELCISNTAGELQNTYFQIIDTDGPDRGGPATIALAPGGLLARKHTLATARSVTSPTGRPVLATGSVAYGDLSASYNHRLARQLFVGESQWQAGPQAGIIIKSGSGPSATSIFESHSSAPFYYNSYADFIDEVRTVAKDYAIIPEFRISEHIEEYLKYGISANNKFDWAEIPGAYTDSGLPVDSSQPGFYKDYSNSEFAHHFLTVKNKSGAEPVEIKLKVNAAIKFNPYKGFYPPQRTLDLITQFSKSYGNNLISTRPTDGVTTQDKNGILRPLIQALFAPGILYNTIKSGIAVDYPIVTDATKVIRGAYTYETASGGTPVIASATNWMIGATGSISPPLGNNINVEGYQGGQYWDHRIGFEDLLNPENLANLKFIDMEPHPSASLAGITASLMSTPADRTYSLMASNFCAGVAEFFLKEKEFTKLESEPIVDGLRFDGKIIYGARLKIRSSKEGPRVYSYESGSSGNNVPYGRTGGKVWDASRKVFLDSTYPLPQDPRSTPGFYETFTMESRPSSFGPPVSGRPTASAIQATASVAQPVDSMNGFNWAYTPPYYNGEAWVDFIFAPSASTSTGAPITYDLEKILSSLDTKYWRCDPGVSASAIITSSTNMVGTVLIPTFSGNCSNLSWREPAKVIGTSEIPLIYEGANVNANAMQLPASVNLFGVERILKTTKDKFGNEIATENETAAAKWVIQPKMETPMLNFNHSGDFPISSSRPLYGSASVSHGMWRQFGIIDPDPNKGVFLELGPIPTQWLKNHYEVLSTNTMYNRGNAAAKGQNAYKNIKPLTDVIKFKPTKKKARLGELAETKTIKEAIVVVPYKMESAATSQTVGGRNPKSSTQARKRFFGISQERITACLKENIGSEKGDSLDAAGMSIRELVTKMDCYVLPPWADFLNNKAVDPFVMYLLEFEYEFDKNDLSYIYQGLAPRNSKNMTLTSRSTAHELNPTELLTAEDVLDPHLRWMVFKVKQKSFAAYEDIIVSQVGESARTKDIFDFQSGESDYSLNYNWPYDYISFVESIKFDVEV
ncbi:hypothetical protein CMI47_10750, partial [Candidatus Pacearchaeota archaeon]|nr:hypothetical protein [Candidatus Pacearchaeota archaeon]